MEIKEMTIDELEQRKAQIADEVETEGADLDALTEEVRAIKAELESRKEAEDKRAEIRSAVAQGAGKEIEAPIVEVQKMEDVRSTKAYIDAYAEYIKTGDDRECRSLLTENASGGDLPVPTFVDDLIHTAWENDQIMSRVYKTYLKGNAKAAFELSATEAEVHSEGTSAPSEEDLQLGIVTLIPKNIKKWITISDEAVAMGGEAFLRYIYDELTYQITKKMAALAVGDVTSASTSSSASAVGVPKTTAAPSVTVFQKAITNLSDEADVNNLVVLLNPATDAAIIDAVAAGNFAQDPYAGLTKIYTSALPAYATADDNAVYAVVGDLSAIQFNFPEGDDVVIKWDDLSLAEADLVKVVGREYAGHAVVKPGRLCNIAKPAAVTT